MVDIAPVCPRLSLCPAIPAAFIGCLEQCRLLSLVPTPTQATVVSCSADRAARVVPSKCGPVPSTSAGSRPLWPGSPTPWSLQPALLSWDFTVHLCDAWLEAPPGRDRAASPPQPWWHTVAAHRISVDRIPDGGGGCMLRHPWPEEMSPERQGEAGGPWGGGGFSCAGPGRVSAGEGHKLDFTEVSLALGETRLCGDTWQARNSDGF